MCVCSACDHFRVCVRTNEGSHADTHYTAGAPLQTSQVNNALIILSILGISDTTRRGVGRCLQPFRSSTRSSTTAAAASALHDCYSQVDWLGAEKEEEEEEGNVQEGWNEFMAEAYNPRGLMAGSFQNCPTM